MFSLSRNLGSSIGISVVETLLTRNTQTVACVACRARHAVQSAHPCAVSGRSAERCNALSALNAQVTEQAAMIAYNDNFKLMLWLSLAAIPLLLVAAQGRRRAAQRRSGRRRVIRACCADRHHWNTRADARPLCCCACWRRSRRVSVGPNFKRPEPPAAARYTSIHSPLETATRPARNMWRSGKRSRATGGRCSARSSIDGVVKQALEHNRTLEAAAQTLARVA